jgi:hypothetical protein
MARCQRLIDRTKEPDAVLNWQRHPVTGLKADPLIAGLIADHGLLVVGGRYDLTSGAVEIIA